MTQHTPKSRGFTLLELLVAIGIIVLIVGIALPMLMKSMKTADKAKNAATMQAITVALDAFKADHGHYPEVETKNTGFAELGRYLIGPYGNGQLEQFPPPPDPNDPNDPPTHNMGVEYLPGDCVQQSNDRYVAVARGTGMPVTDQNYWMPFTVNDRKDGTGYRTGGNRPPQQPYLQPDRFKVRGLAILDNDDNPILYFPARSQKPVITKVPSNPGDPPPFVALSNKSLYDASDNAIFFWHSGENNDGEAVQRIRAMLGDVDGGPGPDGTINSGDTAAYTGPFILWCAGADGLYGPDTTINGAFPTKQEIERCDDVTNFK